jgi:hypothetical protein
MQDLIEHGTSHWANQAHCINGHELTADSTYVQYHPDGRIKKRMCRRCLNGNAKKRRAARRNLPRVCPQCRRQFMLSAGPGAPRKYCSEECSKAARKAA